MEIIKFEHVDPEFIQYDRHGILPKRGTRCSAGYDFATPIDFKLEPFETKVIFTNVKILMPECFFVMMKPRSSIKKKGLYIDGVIDSDYYDNEATGGNIGISITNTSDKVFEFKANERLAQGVLLRYGITCDDDVDNTRVGGFGSTN